MARLQGITGGLSGKLGSAVFRQSGGKTIASQYQPIVKNPNSEGQKNTRAAFKLMSQLAAVMSAGFGSFIIKTRKEKGRASQRNAFFQLNYPLVEVSNEDAQVTAKIPMEQLKLTSSFRFLPNLILSEDAGSGIEIGFEDSLNTDISSIRFVTVGYQGNVPTLVDLRDVPVSRLGGLQIELAPGKYTVLAYGLIPSDSAKSSIDLNNIHTPADETFISAVELNTMVANGSMAETMTVGANITLHA